MSGIRRTLYHATGVPYVTTLTVGPDYYLLTVYYDPSFSSPNFCPKTRTLGAAPVYDPTNSDEITRFMI